MGLSHRSAVVGAAGHRAEVHQGQIRWGITRGHLLVFTASGDATVDTSTGLVTVSNFNNGATFGTLAGQSGTLSGTSSGTNTGDQATSNADGTITVGTGTTNPVVSLALSHANTLDWPADFQHFGTDIQHYHARRNALCGFRVVSSPGDAVNNYWDATNQRLSINNSAHSAASALTISPLATTDSNLILQQIGSQSGHYLDLYDSSANNIF